jgi:cell shape-determining protein MreD
MQALLMVIPSLKVFAFHINIVHIPMEKEAKMPAITATLIFFWGGDRNVFFPGNI